MGRYHTPFIGRPFNQPVTHNQFNDQARAVENSQAISVTPPLTVENTLTGGQRLGINLLPQTAATVSDVKAIAQVVVVPNDQVDEDRPNANSEAVVVRRMTEPDPYTGRMEAGDAVVMKTWWPLKNSDYDAVRHLESLETGDLLNPSDLPVLLPAFDISGEFRAYSPGITGQMFKISSAIASDEIKCLRWNGVATRSPSIWVAKPHWLRGKATWEETGTTRAGITYSGYSPFNTSRTATKTVNQVEVSERQTIVPQYRTGDIITATRMHTGLKAAADNSPVVWHETDTVRDWQVFL